MKKSVLFMVCLLLVVSVSAACGKKPENTNSNAVSSNTSSESEPLNPEYAGYSDIIDRLLSEYGEGRIATVTDADGNVKENGLCGLSVVRLLDFDGDGTYEMYVAVGAQSEDPSVLSVPSKQCFYGFRDGKAYLITDSIPVSKGELDVSPFAQFFITNGKTYYHYRNSWSGAVYTLENGAMTAVLTYDYDPWEQTETGSNINGVPKTSEEIDEALKAYSSGGQNDIIYLYPEPESGNSERLNSVLSETGEAISAIKGE